MSKNNEHGILNKRAAAPPRAIAIITPVDLSRLENESSCDATKGNAIIFNRMAMQLSFRLDALKMLTANSQMVFLSMGLVCW
jgi:hypothetical protein